MSAHDVRSGGPRAAREELRALVSEHGPDIPLDHAVALLAAEEQPGLDPTEVLSALDALAAGLRMAPEQPLPLRVARLVHHLFTDLGFRGEDGEYDAPENSLLNQVLARRRGLPILLSIITVEVARRAGLVLHGVGFPLHFLVSAGPEDGVPRFFLDPFHGGKVVTEAVLMERFVRMARRQPDPDEWEALTAPASPGEVMLRVNRNLKRAWWQRGNPAGALRSVDRMLVLGAEDPGELRDRGLLLVELGRTPAAEVSLRAYLARKPDALDADRVRHLLQDLRSRRT